MSCNLASLLLALNDSAFISSGVQLEPIKWVVCVIISACLLPRWTLRDRGQIEQLFFNYLLAKLNL